MTENGKPKYFTLMEELKEEIISGRIQPGEKLPSENQFTVQYSLSRHTVRKALSLLETGRLYRSLPWKRNFLFRENAPYEKVQKYCGSDNLYFRLHFSQG